MVVLWMMELWHVSKRGFLRHIKPNNKGQTKINQWGDMWPSWVTVSFFSTPWRNVILDWKPPASLVAGSLLLAFLEIHFKQSEQPENDWSNFPPRESIEAAVTLQPVQPLQPLQRLCCELFYLSADKKQTKRTEERTVSWCWRRNHVHLEMLVWFLAAWPWPWYCVPGRCQSLTSTRVRRCLSRKSQRVSSYTRPV